MGRRLPVWALIVGAWLLLPLWTPAHAQDQLAQSFALNGYKRVLEGQWQGIRYASDGNVYFASSTHSAHHGAAFFKYDPATNQVTMLAEDLTTICGEDPLTNPQGKIHSDIVEANGWLYFSTTFSSEFPGAYSRWTGSHVIGYQMATGTFRDYGVTHPNYDSYSAIGVDATRNLLYVFLTGQSGGQVSYLFRIDAVSGVKTNLGQVGGDFNVSHWMFVDGRGDVWFSVAYQNGALRRVRAGTEQIDVYPNALPTLTRWDTDAPNANPNEQGRRFMMWMQPVDGDRAVFTLGWFGGVLYEFDSTKPIGSGQEFKKLRHIGYTDLGLAVGNNRVFYYQHANRAFGHQDAQDFHLLSVSLDSASGYPITDHGLIKDQDGRLTWRIPGMATDKQNRVFMIGDWWIIPGDLGSLRYNYNGGAERYDQLVRGQFFAYANIGGQYTLSVGSTPISNVSITGTVNGQSNFNTIVAPNASIDLNAPLAVTSGGQYYFDRWQLNGVDHPENPLHFHATGNLTATAVYTTAPAAVSPASITLTPGQSQQFAAKIRGIADQSVSWSLSPLVGSISPEGIYQAPASLDTTQTIRVIATSVTDPTKTASADVLLKAPVLVTVTPSTGTVAQGLKLQFSATVQNATSSTVNWSISPATGSISSAGLYTAPATVASNQTITVKATSTVEPTAWSTATITLTPPAAPNGAVRINSGGDTTNFTDPGGRVWLTDRYFQQGGTAYTSTVTGTDSPSLYRSARQGVYTDFTYSIPVSAGAFQVTLKFAELTYTNRGERTFNVKINGAQVLTNFDILSEVAPRVALDKIFDANAVNGRIDIAFTGVVRRAIVSAIEVVPTGTAPVDQTAPGRSAGAPSGVLPSGTVQTSISLQTDESASCRYSSAPGNSFASLTNSFQTVSGLTHTAQVSGLTAGQTYNYYARCSDLAGNVNTTDFAISFQVPGAPPVNNPPVISGGTPGGILAAGTTQATIAVVTDEAATCRYSTSPGTNYAAMTGVFTAVGGINHSAVRTGLVGGQSYSYYVRCQDGGGSANATDYAIAFSVALPGTPGLSTVRINAGGASSDYTDPSGKVWMKDRYFALGGNAYANSVSGTNSVPLYQTGRMGVYTDFSYSIPVTSGTYRVTLKFAELYMTAIGQRIFHVDINSARVLANFDILRQVAPKTAFDASFIVSAPAGKIDMKFTGVAGRGIVSAIEIVPVP